MSSNKTSGSHPKSVDPSKWAWYNHDFSGVPERHAVREPKTTVTKAKRFNPYLFALSLVLFAASLAPYLWDWITTGKAPAWTVLIMGVFLIVGTLSILKVPGLEWMRKGMIFAVSAELLLIGLLTFNGEGLIALALYGSVAALALGYFALKASLPRKEFTYTETIDPLDSGKRVFGSPGGVADAVGVFGEANVSAGVAGEKATAELLDMLLRIPGTFIYHGLQFPGSDNADVDHAVVNGSNVILIDSKQFRAGDYYWGYNEDGDEFISSQSNGTHYLNHMGAAVDGYISYFDTVPVGDVVVSGLVLVHGYGVQIKAGGEHSDGKIILANPQDAMDIIGKHIWGVPPDNRRLRQEMLRWLK